MTIMFQELLSSYVPYNTQEETESLYLGIVSDHKWLDYSKLVWSGLRGVPRESQREVLFW